MNVYPKGPDGEPDRSSPLADPPGLLQPGPATLPPSIPVTGSACHRDVRR